MKRQGKVMERKGKRKREKMSDGGIPADDIVDFCDRLNKRNCVIKNGVNINRAHIKGIMRESTSDANDFTTCK